jgi:hypothetical protein
VGLGFIGGGRKRKIQDLQRKAALLGRLIETCEQALESCTGESDDGGYRAARQVRRGMLQSELSVQRADLDAINAQLAALEDPGAKEGALQGRWALFPTSVARAMAEPFTRKRPRRSLVMAIVTGLVFLMTAVLPAERGFGMVQTLVAGEEDVIVIDPRTLMLVPSQADEGRMVWQPASMVADTPPLAER